MAFDSEKKEVEKSKAGDKPKPKKDTGPVTRKASELVGKTKNGEPIRAWKILIAGTSGTGKTQTPLTIPEYEVEVLGRPKEEILIEYLDMDDGTVPLLEEEVCPFEYQELIQYTLCSNFDEWAKAYERAKANLVTHYEKYGHRGWLIVDNVGKIWEWARDKYCRDSYGMTMLELLEIRRKQAIEAGKRTLPTFDQMADYAVINPLHNDIMEDCKVMSGKGFFNFIWTAPMKEYQGTYSLSGQWENEFRVDYEVRKYVEGDIGNLRFFADLVPGKHRSLSRPFAHLENPTFSRIVAAIEKLKEIERADRAKAKKKKDRAKPKAKKKDKPKEEPKEEPKEKEPMAIVIDEVADVPETLDITPVKVPENATIIETGTEPLETEEPVEEPKTEEPKAEKPVEEKPQETESDEDEVEW